MQKKALKELELCFCVVDKLNNCVNCDHLSREKEPEGQDVSNLLAGIDVFDLDS